MKRRTLAQITVLGIAVALTSTACLGGGGDRPEEGAELPALDGRYELDPNTPAWELDTKEEVTELTWYVNADWWNDEWGNDLITQKIAEDLNIEVTFIKGDDTKLNTMFASGDVADIVTIFGMNSQVAERANTWAYPLDQLAQTYDPYWTEVADQQTMDWLALDDGHTYGYSNYSNTAETYEQGLIPGAAAFIVRQDVWEAIGSPSVATPAEFQAAMQDISEQFPDLIPFGFNPTGTSTGSLGATLQDYLGVPLENSDGTFYDRDTDPTYLTWLDALRQTYTDGNISDDSFADDQTAYEEKLRTGRYATMLLEGLPQAGSFLQTWYSSNPDGQYIAVDGPRGENPPTLNQSGISGWMMNFVSKTASDPAKAMQLFTYLQSEMGGMLTTFGIEGETFEYDADGKIELLPEVMQMRTTNPEEFKKVYRLSEFIFFGHDRYLALQAESMLTPALVQPQDWGRQYLSPHFVLENTAPPAGSAAARNQTAIDTEWATTLVSMIRSGSEDDMTAALDAYLAFREENGWEEIVTIRSDLMAENREKLGL